MAMPQPWRFMNQKTRTSTAEIAHLSTLQQVIPNSESEAARTRALQREIFDLLKQHSNKLGIDVATFDEDIIIAHLEDLTLEQSGAQATDGLTTLRHQFALEPTMQILRYVIYLASNSLISPGC